MSASALSNKQFNTENSIIEQSSDENALVNRVRGIQNMTSNVYRPAFSTDYTAAHHMPSGTADGAQMEGQEDEEA
jgi:hypothetical protein